MTKQKIDLQHSINTKGTVRQEPIKVATQRPLWAFSHADLNGKWAWGQFDDKIACEIFQKLAEFESQTWTELQQSGKHHPIDVTDICQEAQDRLIAMKRYSIDGLFSFRLTGKMRIWGHSLDGVYRVLWWDPDHTVYPFEKKHT